VVSAAKAAGSRRRGVVSCSLPSASSPSWW
jgi:hypothetical protein